MLNKSKIIKKVSLVSAAFLSLILTLVGYYQTSLPDTYYISKGEKLMLDTFFDIQAMPDKEKLPAVSENQPIKKSESSLMLFGSVPIKNVETLSVERPNLIPCGQAFGIKLITDGVMVVDLDKTGEHSPAKDCGILEGDIISAINGVSVKSNADVSDVISNTKGKPCTIDLSRNGKTMHFTLTPEFSNGTYKAGMWVRDSSAGIGTLTFFDPATNGFGGLGHPICDADTGKPLPISKGTVGKVKITGYNKSQKGEPGQLLGEFTDNKSSGDIYLNCTDGVFGRLSESPNTNQKAVPLGFRNEISTGSAYILSTLDDGEPCKYSVSIQQISNKQNSAHDLVIKVTDKRLLEKTGGIVQGMSGSPIIQNGRIVGAVTHVFIDDPSMGYGIFADSMYQNMFESNKNSLKKVG